MLLKYQPLFIFYFLDIHDGLNKWFQQYEIRNENLTFSFRMKSQSSREILHYFLEGADLLSVRISGFSWDKPCKTEFWVIFTLFINIKRKQHRLNA